MSSKGQYWTSLAWQNTGAFKNSKTVAAGKIYFQLAGLDEV
jgi:hypothetical protein